MFQIPVNTQFLLCSYWLQLFLLSSIRPQESEQVRFYELLLLPNNTNIMKVIVKCWNEKHFHLRKGSDSSMLLYQ